MVATSTRASVRIADSYPCPLDPDNDGDVDELCADVERCENDANSGEDNGPACGDVGRARRRPRFPSVSRN